MNNHVYSSPMIAPVQEGYHRPLWSVMIPTHNCAKYLRQTLESVLAQDPGPDMMQIEVIDDCSTRDNPETVVQAVGKGRVTFYRKLQNEGATANFNACIQRSRGYLVHVLHGDDYVLPGFYARIGEVANEYSDLAMFFVRCFVIGEAGSLEHLAKRTKWLEMPTRSPGELFYGNYLYTPGVVIRRSFYELHGGFIPNLVHVADWEMWVRGIALGGGLALNEPLAAYRFFVGNDTNRHMKTAENLRDALRLADIWAARFREFDVRRFKYTTARSAKDQMRRFLALKDFEATAANREVWRALRLHYLRELIVSGVHRVVSAF